VTREQALAAAERARLELGVETGLSLASAEQRIIRLVEGETARVADVPPLPGPTYDLVAWVVTFARGASMVEVALDDATGRAVRVRRTT
jgi:hypothetical protein